MQSSNIVTLTIGIVGVNVVISIDTMDKGKPYGFRLDSSKGDSNNFRLLYRFKIERDQYEYEKNL